MAAVNNALGLLYVPQGNIIVYQITIMYNK
jgi:hypothetical protein